MRIGIGGGIGPFKAGISTKGIGFGVGPVSVGTGWRTSRRTSSHRKGNSAGGGDVGSPIGAVALVVLFWSLVVWWLWNLSPWLTSIGIGLVVVGVALTFRGHLYMKHLAAEEERRYAERRGAPTHTSTN